MLGKQIEKEKLEPWESIEKTQREGAKKGQNFKKKITNSPVATNKSSQWEPEIFHNVHCWLNYLTIFTKAPRDKQIQNVSGTQQ